jgi:hypothetical protein
MSIAEEKKFPDGMVPLENSAFQFACHSGVSCFTHCCRKLELFLYPYDIIRLKRRLAITSEEFLDKYAGVTQGGNPYFPAVILRMLANEEHLCPFLEAKGCRVYEDRPSACRTYPLERAVDRSPSSGKGDDYYFMTNHPYCKGHEEERTWTIKEWLQDQHLIYYNMMDDLWAEMDTLFSKNPWMGEGAAGPRQRLAFMVCYNIDGFRGYALEHQLFRHFKLSKAEIREMEKDDEALLRFGFKWLQYLLADKPTLKPRK